MPRPPLVVLCREQQIIGVFSRAARSAVNVFDVALQGRGPSQVVDVPEGNGSGEFSANTGAIILVGSPARTVKHPWSCLRAQASSGTTKVMSSPTIMVGAS